MSRNRLHRLITGLFGRERASRVVQVCACNDLGKYEKYAAASVGISERDKIRFDNSVDNQPIPTRYNQFIESMPSGLDAWVAFVHNDFQFHDDPTPVLAQASPDHLYGVVGARLDTPTSSGNGQVQGPTYRIIGRVRCSPKLIASGWCGDAVEGIASARTLDCCCIIIHSSLIRRLQLRFNERFEWHMYTEELSLRARRDHGVETYVLPLHSGHYGLGATNDAFFECSRALHAEYPDTFVSTCFNPVHPA